MGITFRELNEMMVFGLDSNNQFVFIDDAKNGYECNCFCPNCHNKLNAKNNGPIRNHHFAHANGSDCKKGHEYTLQLMLKRVLKSESKMLLPRGKIRIEGAFINDYRMVNIHNVIAVKNQKDPLYVSFETADGETVAVYIVISNDEMFDRRLIGCDNLIEIDLRTFKDSELEVEETIRKLLQEETYLKQWIKLSNEKAIICKMLSISSWKSFGEDATGINHFYCPKSKRSTTINDARCGHCEYLSGNIVLGTNISGCVGFIQGPLSVNSIMESSKPDYSNIAGPTYFEMHAERRGNYYAFTLRDLPLAYPEKNYTLVFNEARYTVYFVSLNAIKNNKCVGIEIDPDGNEIGVDLNIDKIYFKRRPWSICSIKEYEITQERIYKLEEYLMQLE